MGEEQNIESSPPSTTREDNFHRIINEIDSLSSLSHTIHVFSVKWQVIQKKLDELTNFLVAAEVSHAHHPKYTAMQVPTVGCNSNNIHSPLSDAFIGISNTVMECREIAVRFINVSYSGKLLMQSDLDTVISKLDGATKSLAAIFQSYDVVTGDLALVVLKPPLGAAQAKSYEIREMAYEALSTMVLLPKNRKKFANDDHNIRLSLQLLDLKERNSGNFKFLLSILLSLSNCNHARKKFSHCGYVKNIEKHADAKRSVRKLSTNRFKNLLNGI